ncbi:MAG: hypothetical protein RDV48_06760 [Candidatus Eremiobacteraeota bacterium]|nr:hypothetical protein [Candidatus Eremiobacteraeota bacterium]
MDEVKGTDEIPRESEGAGATLTLAANFLSPENILQWLTYPLFPEVPGHITVSFIAFGEIPLLFCTKGMVLRLPAVEGEAYQLKGQTAPFNTNLAIRKDAEGYFFKGILLGETADYSIRKEGRSFAVVGDTGKFRTNYRITSMEEGFDLEGDTGQYNSKVLITPEGKGYAVRGLLESKKIDLSLFEEEGKYHYQGTVEGASHDIVVEQETPSIINVSGPQCSLRTEFQIMGENNEVRITGAFRGVKGHLTVTLEEVIIHVAGGFDTSRVGYSITKA